MARLGDADPKTAEVVDDLTRVLSRKILTDATFSVRASAEEGDLASCRIAREGDHPRGPDWERHRTGRNNERILDSWQEFAVC